MTTPRWNKSTIASTCGSLLYHRATRVGSLGRVAEKLERAALRGALRVELRRAKDLLALAAASAGTVPPGVTSYLGEPLLARLGGLGALPLGEAELRAVVLQRLHASLLEGHERLGSLLLKLTAELAGAPLSPDRRNLEMAVVSQEAGAVALLHVWPLGKREAPELRVDVVLLAGLAHTGPCGLPVWQAEAHLAGGSVPAGALPPGLARDQQLELLRQGFLALTTGQTSAVLEEPRRG